MGIKIDEIQNRVGKLFMEQFELEKIDVEKNYFDGDMANSIDALQLLVKIEEEFDIDIDDEDLSAELISSVVNIADYVDSKLNN